MAKPKIIHTLYSGLGGHGSVVFPLLESHFKTDFDNVIIFYGIEEVRPEYVQKCENLGITYYAVKKLPKRYLKAISKVNRILTLEKPDSIIVHSSELIFAAVKYARKQNCSTFYVEHEPLHTKTRFEKVLTKYAGKHAKKIICLNEAYKTSLPIDDNKIVVIPNGINCKKFELIETEDNCEIGIAARITDTKDHISLIKAFQLISKQHNQYTLKIAGDGNLKAKMVKLVADLKLENKVEFVGLLNELDLIHFLQNLDLYVHATKSETLSTAILQAMAVGLPVITSDIENNALLIKNGENGWLYRNSDFKDLAEKILYAIEHKTKAKEIGKAAHEHAKNSYSVEKMADRYKSLIQQF